MKCQLKVTEKWLNFVLRNCRAGLFKQTIFSNSLTENYLIIYFTYILKIHSPNQYFLTLFGPQVERFQFLNPRILKRYGSQDYYSVYISTLIQFLPFSEFKMTVETVLALEILPFKIWKVFYKKQNFWKLFKHQNVKSILIFNPKHCSDKYFSEFQRWWKLKTSLLTSISLATQERSIVHINHNLINLLW